MEADLAAVNRTKTPWIILNGHRPIYTTSSGGSAPYGVVPVALDLQEALEPLLYKYSVDLTWHGTFQLIVFRSPTRCHTTATD